MLQRTSIETSTAHLQRKHGKHKDRQDTLIKALVMTDGLQNKLSVCDLRAFWSP